MDDTRLQYGYVHSCPVISESIFHLVAECDQARESTLLRQKNLVGGLNPSEKY